MAFFVTRAIRPEVPPSSKSFLQHILSVAAVAGALQAGYSPALADINISQFDTADDLLPWYPETWAEVQAQISWDPAVDSQDLASGSMLVEMDFDSPSGEIRSVFTRSLPEPLDITQATSVHMDVLIDPSSPTRGWGDNGFLSVIARNGANWDWNADTSLFDGSVYGNSQWLSIDVPPKLILNDVRAFTVQLWGEADPANGVIGLVGLTRMWIDNVKIVGIGGHQEGDTDDDGDVDLTDLNNVRNQFGNIGLDILGDTDDDDDVDLTDLNNVRNNFGAGPPAGSPVPESAGLMLALLGAIGLAVPAFCRRKRR
jgi:hypothetical protein